MDKVANPQKRNISGDVRRKQWYMLRELQKGLGSRQMIVTVCGLGLKTLESDNLQDWKAGEPPELHVSIPGTSSPVVVRVSEDLYVWERADGGERACPVWLFSKALEMVICTVNVS